VPSETGFLVPVYEQKAPDGFKVFTDNYAEPDKKSALYILKRL
jgi:hypothetical protein